VFLELLHLNYAFLSWALASRVDLVRFVLSHFHDRTIGMKISKKNCRFKNWTQDLNRQHRIMGEKERSRKPQESPARDSCEKLAINTLFSFWDIPLLHIRLSFGIVHSRYYNIINDIKDHILVRPREIGTGGTRVTSNHDNETHKAQTLFFTTWSEPYRMTLPARVSAHASECPLPWRTWLAFCRCWRHRGTRRVLQIQLNTWCLHRFQESRNASRFAVNYL
jgi:hypothetical protein